MIDVDSLLKFKTNWKIIHGPFRVNCSDFLLDFTTWYGLL